MESFSRQFLKRHPSLFSLLLVSRSHSKTVRKAVGRVDWCKLLWACCAATLLCMLVTVCWWVLHLRQALISAGIDSQAIEEVLHSKDPAHAAALVARRSPQLIEYGRRALVDLTKESERVIVIPELNRVIFDVSAEHTFRFVFTHMLQHHKAMLFPELMPSHSAKEAALAASRRMVVDFGAFDGVIASNSYNFLELGWRALLVEPTPAAFKTLHETTARFEDRKFLENVAVGNEDKDVTLYIYDNPTSNSMFQRDRYGDEKAKIVVPMRRASGILQYYKISKKFGVLSIDVEGVEMPVLNDVLDAGYQPMYIIIEKVTLGTSQLDVKALVKQMKAEGYSLAAQIHLNCIFHYDG
ncbi:hypothetical protein BSKO_10227 [Bryopsis sp. KO-2023]|nr:hypothetical protein BSKO_10227 [Bryopsis sp. KO-2023]